MIKYLQFKFEYFLGKGPFFSSGNDLTNFAPAIMNPTPEAFKELAETSKKKLESYVAAFIDFRGTVFV